MKRIRAVDRGGQSLVALIVVAVIIGYLWKTGILRTGGGTGQAPLDPRQASSAPKRPQVAQPGQPAPTVQQSMPVIAVENGFKATAQQVRSAVATYQINKGGNPTDLADLHRETGVDLPLDPYGGQYYVQNGYLRCTGNPNLYEKVW